MDQLLGPEHFGAERAESEVAKAERIIAQELKRRRWRQADLKSRPKGEAVKVALAVKLRTQDDHDGAMDR